MRCDATYFLSVFLFFFSFFFGNFEQRERNYIKYVQKNIEAHRKCNTFDTIRGDKHISLCKHLKLSGPLSFKSSRNSMQAVQKIFVSQKVGHFHFGILQTLAISFFCIVSRKTCKLKYEPFAEDCYILCEKLRAKQFSYVKSRMQLFVSHQIHRNKPELVRVLFFFFSTCFM